ncbi:MAG TPA: glycosyl transferase family 9 [Planctomycetaceae bacterium]|nr:glycosyl transferase family 9 [Planctomycetaceae bacterium]
MSYSKDKWFELPTPQRILIVRFSAIGDVTHGLPVLNALRTRFPRAEIAWLVEDKTASLLYGHPSLDRLIITKKRWMKSFEEIRLLRKRLHAFAPDVTIDLQGLFKSSFAAWISGAKHRIGFAGADGREGSRWFNNIRVAPTENHVIERNLQLLEPFGIDGCSIDFELPECDADRRTATRIHKELGFDTDFVIINVGAGWTSKLWREDRYAAVTRYLKEQWNLPSLVVWAGDAEKNMAGEVVRRSDGHAVLAPQTSLCELASLSRMATLFIGSDTGPLHIAVAVGTPCIGLYGPMPAKRNGPYGHRHRAIQIESIEGTRIKPRHAPRDLMDAIEVRHVCEACDDILGKETVLRENPNYTFPSRRHVA